MAIHSKIFLAMLSLVFIGSSAPRALGLIIDGKTISGCNIGGVLVCVNQALSLGQTCNPIVGVNVELRCGSGSSSSVLKTVTTDASGKYFFVFNLLEALLFNPSNCYVEAQINSAHCSLPVPSAVLRAPIVVLDVVQALLGGLLGNLLTCATGPVSWVA